MGDRASRTRRREGALRAVSTPIAGSGFVLRIGPKDANLGKKFSRALPKIAASNDGGTGF
jgi:hypothetical protein